MILGHRIRLDPTEDQIVAFKKACGVARFTYNWALEEWNRQYEAGGKPNSLKLCKLWNSVKGTRYAWVYDSPKDANQYPFISLNRAFKRFFGKVSGYPSFKCKGDKESFYTSNTALSIHDNFINLYRIGSIRMFESMRLKGRIMNAVVSREADKWFISISVDVGDLVKLRASDAQIGVDLGLKTAIVTSDGEAFDAPKPLKKNLKKLARLSRQHSRKQKGSKNKEKSRIKLARLHSRMANIRKDWTHKITTKLCRENQTICLEDLKVKNMMKNHCLAQSISDVRWSEIRRQLEYKATIYVGKVVVINQWLPTSKTCSNCGCKKEELSLKERIFHCDDCGFTMDRDLNASHNILAAGLAVLARGQEGSDAQTIERETILDEAGISEELTSVSSD